MHPFRPSVPIGPPLHIDDVPQSIGDWSERNRVRMLYHKRDGGPLPLTIIGVLGNDVEVLNWSKASLWEDEEGRACIQSFSLYPDSEIHQNGAWDNLRKILKIWASAGCERYITTGIWKEDGGLQFKHQTFADPIWMEVDAEAKGTTALLRDMAHLQLSGSWQAALAIRRVYTPLQVFDDQGIRIPVNRWESALGEMTRVKVEFLYTHRTLYHTGREPEHIFSGDVQSITILEQGKVHCEPISSRAPVQEHPPVLIADVNYACGVWCSKFFVKQLYNVVEGGPQLLSLHGRLGWGTDLINWKNAPALWEYPEPEALLQKFMLFNDYQVQSLQTWNNLKKQLRQWGEGACERHQVEGVWNQMHGSLEFVHSAFWESEFFDANQLTKATEKLDSDMENLGFDKQTKINLLDWMEKSGKTVYIPIKVLDMHGQFVPVNRWGDALKPNVRVKVDFRLTYHPNNVRGSPTEHIITGDAFCIRLQDPEVKPAALLSRSATSNVSLWLESELVEEAERQGRAMSENKKYSRNYSDYDALEQEETDVAVGYWD